MSSWRQALEAHVLNPHAVLRFVGRCRLPVGASPSLARPAPTTRLQVVVRCEPSWSATARSEIDSGTPYSKVQTEDVVLAAGHVEGRQALYAL